MGFRKIRGINVSYSKQGQIYFALANYSAMPAKTKQGIDRLIREAAYEGNAAGDVYEKALRAWLIKGEAWQSVIDRYHVRPNTMIEKRKWIYQHW